MSAFERVAHMLGQCGTEASVLPPTALYNEGWMLRLVLDWYSSSRDGPRLLRFEDGSRWYSEALLGSRFFGSHRGDARAEGWTHADAVVGHFRLRPGGRGDIELVPSAAQLTVIEAKMGSLLSAGTKNAPAFDQAARNVACIAQVMNLAKRTPAEFLRLEFLVLAPEARIREGAFTQQLDKAKLGIAVANRAAAFGDEHAGWLAECFAPTLAACAITALAWEQLLAEIAVHDPPAGQDLKVFYQRCLAHNPMSPLRAGQEKLFNDP